MRRVSGGVHERRDDRRRAVHLRDRHRRRGGLRPAGRVPLSGTRPTRSHATKAVTGPVVVRMMGFQAITRVEHVCATGRPAGAPPSPPPPSPPPPTSTRSRLPRRTTCSLAPRHVGARFARSSARFARAHARFARVVMLSARRPRTQVSRRPLPSRARARPRAEGFDVQEADNLNNLHLHRRLHHHRHHPAGPARVRPPAPPRTHRGAGTRTTRTSHTSLPEAGRPPSSPMAATRPHLGALRAPPPTHLGALRAPTPTHPPHTVALRAPTLWRASRANPHVLRPSEAKATRSQGHRSRGHQKPRRRNQKEPTCHRPERSRGP